EPLLWRIAMLSDDQCYQAILSRDRRFDGVFFVGVSSTGIYCRSVCTVKAPMRKNCTFYPSAAAAEQANYRPCLRCRPELAPGQAKIDAVSRLATAAASRIESGALTQQSVGALAVELGISDRHLRRVLKQEFGVSPIQLAQTQRLLLAKRLLSDTQLSITDIAFASGFSSVRRLNALFQKRYRLKPSALRSATDNTIGKATVNITEMPQDVLHCELAYRPPLNWQGLLSFLKRRAVAGVETIENNRYQRTVRLGKHQGWIQVACLPKKNKLTVALSAGLIPVILPVLTRVKALFDLAADPLPIAKQLKDLHEQLNDAEQSDLGDSCLGIRVPGAFNGFEVAVRTVLGQQVSVKAASTLMARLVNAVDDTIETPIPGLTHLTPTPEQIETLPLADLSALGILPSRGNTLLQLAHAVTHDNLQLHNHADINATVAALKALPGIGDWSAQYIAMRVLAYPDAFPAGDLGLRHALKVEKPAQVLKIAEAWRPWRAYAAISLWQSLEQPSLKQPPMKQSMGQHVGKHVEQSDGNFSDRSLKQALEAS
ncbi:MAG: AlkA N-terminal domain-containing protein, partial [Cyanobacteria bacterium P01_F01_bin.53]